MSQRPNGDTVGAVCDMIQFSLKGLGKAHFLSLIISCPKLDFMKVFKSLIILKDKLIPGLFITTALNTVTQSPVGTISGPDRRKGRAKTTSQE